MQTVVFVAPFFMDMTLRFVDATASLPGVRVGLVSQDPAERLPGELRAKLAAHWRVDNGLDADQIVGAVEGLARQIGRPSRLVGALEQLQVPLAIARQKLGIDGMDVETALNFRDKARMKTKFRDAGLPCARHCLAASPEEAWGFARAVGYPLVAKPPAGAGAKGTYRVDNDGQMGELLAMIRPHGHDPLLFEEFITGDEHSFDTISVGGRPVWHSLTHYLPNPLDAVRNPWIQWCVLLPREVDHPRYDDIRHAAFRALEVLGMRTGLSHMEWFRRPDGSVAISEVAARPPGAQITTLISWAHEIDFRRAWANLMVNGEFQPPQRRYAAGAAFLRGQGQGRVKAIHGLDQAQRELGHLVVEVSLPKAGQVPSTSYEGEGYVVLRHPETRVVEEGLARLIRLIRVELG